MHGAIELLQPSISQKLVIFKFFFFTVKTPFVKQNITWNSNIIDMRAVASVGCRWWGLLAHLCLHSSSVLEWGSETLSPNIRL